MCIQRKKLKKLPLCAKNEWHSLNETKSNEFADSNDKNNE
jgi:hypothetical protein